MSLFSKRDTLDSIFEPDQEELLYSSVQRLKRYSLIMKCTTVILIGLALLFLRSAAAPLLCTAAIGCALTFWFVDAYFLSRRRFETRLYLDLTKGADPVPDASYAALYKRYPCRPRRYPACFRSYEVMWFYFPFLGMAILVAIFARFTQAAG